jgi:hypothetical protein
MQEFMSSKEETSGAGKVDPHFCATTQTEK